MDKEELESLVIGSLKDIATAIKKLEILDEMSNDIKSTNRKLDVIEQRKEFAEIELT